MLYLVTIGFNGIFLCGGCYQVDIFAFRCKNHEGHTEHGVGTRCENSHLHIAILHFELHFGTFRTPDPVALSFLYGIRPGNIVKVVEQARGIGADTEAPLVHQFLLHGITASHRHTLAYLVVGKHCAEFRTPVHHRVAEIGDAVVHQHIAFLLCIHGVPFPGCKPQCF